MDEFQEKASSFLIDYAKPIAIAFLALVLIGGGIGVFKMIQTSRDQKSQGQFGAVEREYTTLKQKFLQAETQKNQPPPKEGETRPPAQTATGDMEKDYGTIVARFQEVIRNYEGSQAAKMSALYLSEIYADHAKLEDARKALESAKANGTDLLSVLVGHRMATLIADEGRCPEAREKWQSLIAKSPGYLKNEMKLRTAICHEREGQIDQAKSLYTELTQAQEGEGDASISKEADKYLRLLQFRKENPQVGKNN